MKKIIGKGCVLFQYRLYSDFFFKSLWIEIFEEKKNISENIFFKLQCLVDHLDELDVGLGNEKKSILLHNSYILFS